MIKLKPLIEKTIGKVSRKINITIELDKTKHAGERQFRDGKEITDTEILAVAQRAIEPISRDLLADDINIGDYILIKDTKTNLNLVGVLKEKNDILEFIIVTVMKKQNFKPKAGTKSITI